MMPRRHEERRAALESQLAANPALTKAVRDRIAERRLPAPLLGAIEKEAGVAPGAGSSPLEGLAQRRTTLPMLEAIVKLTGRPPMLVRNDKVVMEPLPAFPTGTDLQVRGVEKWIPSVGRIEFVNADMAWGGELVASSERAERICWS